MVAVDSRLWWAGRLLWRDGRSERRPFHLGGAPRPRTTADWKNLSRTVDTTCSYSAVVLPTSCGSGASEGEAGHKHLVVCDVRAAPRPRVLHPPPPTRPREGPPWHSHPSRPASASAATSPPRASTPTTRSTWERRDARITNFQDGSVAFEQLDVEFPTTWSVNATNIVAQKYFRGTPGTAERESSLRQVIDRVADTITQWGLEGGYFVDDDEAETYNDELKHLLVTQKAAFNSPVWFNIGVPGVPAAGLGLLHPLRRRPDGLDPQLVRRGGHDLQGRLRLRHQPVEHPLARWSCSRAAAPPPARSASCGAPTPRPARSSPAARPGAPPRWSSSTSTTPTWRSSSGSRPARRRRSGSSRRPAST